MNRFPYTQPPQSRHQGAGASGFTLIELLVVLAILGVLMSLLFPAVTGALNTARKTQAQNDVTQIANAITMYESEYGQWPTNASGTPANVEGDFLRALMGTNARRMTFLEVPDAKRNRGGLSNGIYVDPWGGAYRYVVNTNYESSVVAGESAALGGTNTTIRKRLAVWNTNSNTRLRVATW